jgi:hypothetical protein
VDLVTTGTKPVTWQTRLENAIAWLSPVWAYRRACQRQRREDEQRRERQARAAARDRRDGWRPVGEQPLVDRSWLQRRRDRRRAFHWDG